MAWSGGKDSALALHRLLGDARWDVKGLLTTINADHDRVSVHDVRRTILHAQAASGGTIGLGQHETDCKAGLDQGVERERGEGGGAGEYERHGFPG